MEEPAGTGELLHSNPFLSIAPPALQGKNKEKGGPEDHSPAGGAAGQYGAREAIPSSILPPPALPHTQPKSFFSAALKPRKYLSSDGTALPYMSSKRTARSFLLTLPAAQTLHERNLLWKHISLRLQLNLKQMLLPSNGNGLSNSQLCQVGLAAG